MNCSYSNWLENRTYGMGEGELIDYYQSQGIELFNAGAKSRLSLCDRHKKRAAAPPGAGPGLGPAGTAAAASELSTPEPTAVWPTMPSPNSAFTTPKD